MIIDHYQPSLTLLRLSANIYLQTFAMWQGLLIRASTPIVRVPHRTFAFTSIRSKGDEKVDNVQCTLFVKVTQSILGYGPSRPL